MSAENDRVRQILGIDLARAAAKANAGDSRQWTESGRGGGGESSSRVMYFSSFEQFQDWCDSGSRSG